MSKIIKVANRFRTKLSQYSITNLLTDLSDEIHRQMQIANRQFSVYSKNEDPYGPSFEEFQKLEKHFDFLLETLLGAFTRSDYSHMKSLVKEIYRTIRDNDLAFTDLGKILNLIGLGSSAETGLMGAIDKAKQDESVYPD